MGWFDSDKNNTGALCARLSSNAEAISGVAGAKVGQAISGLTTLFFGTGLGCYCTCLKVSLKYHFSVCLLIINRYWAALKEASQVV